MSNKLYQIWLRLFIQSSVVVILLSCFCPLISQTSKIDYAGGFVYKNNSLDFFKFPEGRVTVNDGQKHQLEYQYNDHLGNSRASFAQNSSGKLVVLQENHYYPFGLNLGGTKKKNDLSSENKFTYNNKELEDANSLQWYHYGARYYDPQIAKWTTQDPADEFHSAYTYVHNDPVNYVDPDGQKAYFVGMSGWFLFSPNKHTKKLAQKTHAKSPFQRALNLAGAVFRKEGLKKVTKFLQDEDIYVHITPPDDMGAEHLFQGRAAGHAHRHTRVIQLATDLLSPRIAHNLNDQNINTLDGARDYLSVYLHEVVHLMGYGEFGAFAAQLAAGFTGAANIDNDLLKNPNYISDGRPKSFDRFFGKNNQPLWLDGDGNITNGDMARKFWNEFYEYGKEVIGKE